MSRILKGTRHVIPIAIMLGGYACIADITHATEGFYTYGFLDPTKHKPGALAGILIGMGALAIAMFILSWCLIWLRLWVTEVRMGLPGKFSSHDAARAGTVSSNSSGGFIDKSDDTQERIEMVDKTGVRTSISIV